MEHLGKHRRQQRPSRLQHPLAPCAREGFYSVNAGGAPPTPWQVLVECTELEPQTESSGGYGSGPTGRWLNSGGTLSNQGMLRPFEDGHLTGSLSGEGEGAAVAWHWDFMAK